MHTPEEHLIDAYNTLLRWCAVLTIALTLVIGLATWGVIRGNSAVTRVRHDEGQTCLIQKRSLPAGKDLVNAFIGMDALVASPETTAQRKNQHLTTTQAAGLKELTSALNDFKRIEKKQPLTISCVK